MLTTSHCARCIKDAERNGSDDDEHEGSSDEHCRLCSR